MPHRWGRRCRRPITGTRPPARSARSPKCSGSATLPARPPSASGPCADWVRTGPTTWPATSRSGAGTKPSRACATSSAARFTKRRISSGTRMRAACFSAPPGSGFGRIKQETAIERSLLAPIDAFERDPASIKPVDDAVFAGVSAALRLRRGSARCEGRRMKTRTPPHWARQRVSFRAAYGTQRVAADLFIPKAGRAPYQSPDLSARGRCADARDRAATAARSGSSSCCAAGGW